MNLSLKGHHALVCGASKGIGLATARALADMGASVTLCARSPDLLEAARSSLPSSETQNHRAMAVDFDHRQALQDAVDELVAASPVNILVNNSGGPPGGPLLNAEAEDFLAPFGRHLLCSQLLVQRCLGGMKATGYGRIVNIISTSVREPIPGLGVSNTVRGAMASWAKTLSAELGPHEITINNVLPGFTDTVRLEAIIAARATASGQSEQQVAESMKATVPFGRFASADEVAAMIAFLTSPAASYVSGQSIAVDGGRTKSI